MGCGEYNPPKIPNKRGGAECFEKADRSCTLWLTFFLHLCCSRSNSSTGDRLWFRPSGGLHGGCCPGREHTVTSLETRAARTLRSDEAGTYRVLSLPVGRYEVKAEAAGFRTALQTGVRF